MNVLDDGEDELNLRIEVESHATTQDSDGKCLEHFVDDSPSLSDMMERYQTI